MQDEVTKWTGGKGEEIKITDISSLGYKYDAIN